MHENRETSRASARADRRGKVKEPSSWHVRCGGVGLRHGTDEATEQRGECFRGGGGGRGADQGERRPSQRGSGTERSNRVPGVRRRASNGTSKEQERFTALLHHLTIDLLRESYHALKRRAAPGVDGESWQQYESGLEERLIDLHSRVNRGAYRAQPSRRVYIPKADGRQRPLGIASLEDKIVQHAVATILNQIYEVDFRLLVWGSTGRSPHQALDALNVGIQRKRVNWILDADIRGFFDNMSHEWTMKFMEHRVADPASCG